MAACGIDWRHEQQIGTGLFGGPQFAQIVDGGGDRAAMAPVASIGPPLPGKPLRPSEQQDVTTPPGNRPDGLEERAALLGGCCIMAKDDARSLRQGAYRVHHAFAQTLIGHQPDPGQGKVALRHRRPYSAHMTNDAKQRRDDVQAAMEKAARTAGRHAADIQLIAISKTYEADAIRPLIAAGQRAFGENRVQEAQGKWPALVAETLGIELHLVGQLQSNKAEDAVRLFDVIHSLDRPSLIDALAKAQEKTGRRLRYFLQVNIGEEDQKGGCAAADVPALLAQASAAGLDVVGLMAVPPADTAAAPYFALLAKTARENGLSALSMGMSGDFEAAIMLGATQIRIGTALFGAR